jgi:hypothetical protein
MAQASRVNPQTIATQADGEAYRRHGPVRVVVPPPVVVVVPRERLCGGAEGHLLDLR